MTKTSRTGSGISWSAGTSERPFILGWSDLVNGELIASAEAAGFDVMITADKNLRYQQNLTSRKLAARSAEGH